MALLARVRPLLGDERDFALKGGTAINLFHRGMPRLSFDLDLTLRPVAVTPVLRGSVYAPETRDVPPLVEDRFDYARAQLVSCSDLYAGTLVAALDRQNPRDLFDVRELLANEGIDDPTRQAFLAYLVNDDRPITEVLEARPKDLRATFRTEIEGMTQG